MTLKHFFETYISFTGTTLQVEKNRNELLNKTASIEFKGIISDVKNNKILINEILTEMNIVDKSICLFEPLVILTKQIQDSKLLELSVGDLIKVKCSNLNIQPQNTNQYFFPFILTVELVDFSSIQVGKVCIINEGFNDYQCYLNGMDMIFVIYGRRNEDILTLPTYRYNSPYTFYLTEKGNHEIRLEQKNGFLLFPTVYKLKVVEYNKPNQIINYEIPT